MIRVGSPFFMYMMEEKEKDMRENKLDEVVKIIRRSSKTHYSGEEASALLRSVGIYDERESDWEYILPRI